MSFDGELNKLDNPDETKIDLQGISFSAQDATALAQKIRTHRKIISLNLTDCKLGDKVVKILMDGIVDNQSLRELNLAANGIRETGCEAIGNFIKKTQSLKVLRVAHNPLTDKGIDKLTLALVHNTSLISIDLSCTEEITNTGVEALLKVVKKYNKNLLIVNLLHSTSNIKNSHLIAELQGILNGRTIELYKQNQRFIEIINTQSYLSQRDRTSIKSLITMKSMEAARNPVVMIPLGLLALYFGAMKFIYEDTAFSNKHRSMGAFFMGMSLLMIAISMIYEYLKFRNSVIEIIDASKNAIAETGSTIKAVGTTVTDLGTRTGNVIVELNDCIKKSIVQLRGDAQAVAKAIQKGIDEGRFKPELNADVNVTAGHDINVRGISLW